MPSMKAMYCFLCLFVAPVITAIPDWLVTKITTKTELQKVDSDVIRLTNGLIHRDFLLCPDFTTIDFYSLERASSIIRAVGPEAVIGLDGIEYNIGGVLTGVPRAYFDREAFAKNKTLNPKAFHYVSHSTRQPEAKFPYVPKRGAPKDIAWPPRGLRLDVLFEAPTLAPIHHRQVKATVHYEMYDGIPLIAKWLSVVSLPGLVSQINVSVSSVEYLAVNQEWASTGTSNTVEGGGFAAAGPPAVQGWLYLETDQPHSTQVIWGNDPVQSLMPGSFEPVVNCTYETQPGVSIHNGFESFRAHELVIGSDDPERVALAKHKLMRLLAPQTQENPIFFHLTNATSTAFREAIDQMADVGFEMLIYSFGSGVDVESDNETYIKQVAADVAYARSKGIEVGAYDLIAWTRTVKPEWMAVSGSGACFASGWYDFLLERLLNFFNKTGMTMIETDGPYPGYKCSATNHSHHLGEQDSVYWQEKLQGEFYSRLQAHGIYTNQPDRYFYQGGSKTGMGYAEYQFSLPRWQDISVSRQSVYDDSYHLIPTAGWMFVPLVDYHSGGAAAAFEPLQDHVLEYEWALAQYLGAGVAACYRGYRLYDGDKTRAMVKKWVSFYHKYRDIITSDIIHIRRPDMQWIDSYMHVNPFLKTKALAMVFNPTPKYITTTLTLPLYYAGLTDTALVGEQEHPKFAHQLDRLYNIHVKIDLPPYNITWFTVE